MRKLVSLLLVLFLIGCTGENVCIESEAQQRWMEPNGRVKVLCTIAMISDLVEQIGGDQVDCLTLISGGLDPHSYQLVKGDDEKLLAADLILFNGLGLEHGPSLRQSLIESDKAVSVGDHLREKPGEIFHVDGLPDPHIWMDISMWEQGVDPIVRSLSRLRPDHATDFQKRGERVSTELLAAHFKVKKAFEQLSPEKRYLVTSHDAFHYFARAYLATKEEQEKNSWQERCAAPEGLAPDSMLSVSDIREIISHIERYNVKVIFSESNINQDSIRKIVSAAQEKGLEVHIADCALYSDAIGCPGSEGDTYLKMLEFNARCILEQLR